MVTHRSPVSTPSQPRRAALPRYASIAAQQRKPLIAVVDDDAIIRRSLNRLLAANGYDAITFGSGYEFVESVAAAPVAIRCVVLDMQMPGLDGLEVQRQLRLLRSEVPVIFLSGSYNWRAREAALRGGALAYFTKPLYDDADALLRLVGSVMGSAKADAA